MYCIVQFLECYLFLLDIYVNEKCLGTKIVGHQMCIHMPIVSEISNAHAHVI